MWACLLLFNVLIKEMLLDKKEILLDKKEILLDKKEILLDKKEMFFDKKKLNIDIKEIGNGEGITVCHPYLVVAELSEVSKCVF